MSRKARSCRYFFRENHGNVAIIFGLMTFVLVGATALAVDYHRLSSLQARLQAAADVAVLAAVNTENTNAAEIEQHALQHFMGSLSSSDAATVSSMDAVYEDAPVKKVQLTFSGMSPNTISSVANVDAFPVSGQAVAVADVPVSKRIHFLMDVSSSMGLASTPADRNALRAATIATTGPDGCEFACHVNDPPAPVPVTLDIARGLGVNLRIDAAREGIAHVISLAEASRTSMTRYEYSLTTFASDIWSISPPTSDVPSFMSRMNAIELGQGLPITMTHTRYDVAIPKAVALYNSFPRSVMDEIVVLVTDGWHNGSSSGPWHPVPANACNVIKASGRKVAVVYLTQLPIPHNATWVTYVEPHEPEIEPNMRACASDDMFVKGLDRSHIVSAFGQVFDLMDKKRSVRLTR